MRVSRGVVAIAAAVTCAVLGSAGVSFGCASVTSPYLEQLNPNQGPAGTKVMARGGNWTANQSVVLSWRGDGSILATVMPAPNGAFSYEITIPKSAARSYPYTEFVNAAQGTRRSDTPFGVDAAESATVTTEPPVPQTAAVSTTTTPPPRTGSTSPTTTPPNPPQEFSAGPPPTAPFVSGSAENSTASGAASSPAAPTAAPRQSAATAAAPRPTTTTAQAAAAEAGAVASEVAAGSPVGVSGGSASEAPGDTGSTAAGEEASRDLGAGPASSTSTLPVPPKPFFAVLVVMALVLPTLWWRRSRRSGADPSSDLGDTA